MNSFKNGCIQLAKLALDFADKTLADRQVRPEDVELVLDTLHAAQWSKVILTQVGSNRISKILQILRGANISATAYSSLKQLLLCPIQADSLEIEQWGMRSELAQKYHIQSTIATEGFKMSVMKIAQGPIRTPLDLAQIDKKQAFALDQMVFPNGAITLLWQCAKCHMEFPTNRTARRFVRDPIVLPRLMDNLKGKSLEESGAHREFQNLAETIGLPPGYDKLTPGAKVKLLKGPGLTRRP